MDIEYGGAQQLRRQNFDHFSPCQPWGGQFYPGLGQKQVFYGPPTRLILST